MFLISIDLNTQKELLIIREILEEKILGGRLPGIIQVFPESQVFESVFGEEEFGQKIEGFVGDTPEIDGSDRGILIESLDDSVGFQFKIMKAEVSEGFGLFEGFGDLPGTVVSKLLGG